MLNTIEIYVSSLMYESLGRTNFGARSLSNVELISAISVDIFLLLSAVGLLVIRPRPNLPVPF
jgi:hypothetical protein